MGARDTGKTKRGQVLESRKQVSRAIHIRGPHAQVLGAQNIGSSRHRKSPSRGVLGMEHPGCGIFLVGAEKDEVPRMQRTWGIQGTLVVGVLECKVGCSK